MRFEQRCAFLRKWYETMEGKFTLDIIQNERHVLLTHCLEINQLEIVLPSLFFAGKSAFVHPKEAFFERMLLSRDNPWWSISNVLDKIIQGLMIKLYSECGSDQAMDRCFFFDLFESGKYFLTEQNKGEIILQEMMCIVDSNLSKDTKFNVLNDFFQQMISVHQDGLFAVRGACLYALLPSDKRGMVSIAFYEFLCDLIHTEKTSLSINKDQFFLLLKDVSKYDYNLIFQSESEDKFEPVIDEPYSIKWLSSGCLEYFKPEDAIHITDLLKTITAYYNGLSREGFSDRLGY